MLTDYRFRLESELNDPKILERALDPFAVALHLLMLDYAESIENDLLTRCPEFFIAEWDEESGQ